MSVGPNTLLSLVTLCSLWSKSTGSSRGWNSQVLAKTWWQQCIARYSSLDPVYVETLTPNPNKGRFVWQYNRYVTFPIWILAYMPFRTNFNENKSPNLCDPKARFILKQPSTPFKTYLRCFALHLLRSFVARL